MNRCEVFESQHHRNLSMNFRVVLPDRMGLKNGVLLLVRALHLQSILQQSRYYLSAWVLLGRGAHWSLYLMQEHQVLTLYLAQFSLQGTVLQSGRVNVQVKEGKDVDNKTKMTIHKYFILYLYRCVHSKMESESIKRQRGV